MYHNFHISAPVQEKPRGKILPSTKRPPSLVRSGTGAGAPSRFYGASRGPPIPQKAVSITSLTPITFISETSARGEALLEKIAELVELRRARGVREARERPELHVHPEPLEGLVAGLAAGELHRAVVRAVAPEDRRRAIRGGEGRLERRRV